MTIPLFMPLPAKQSDRQGSRVSDNLISAIESEHGRKAASECQVACARLGSLRDASTKLTSVSTPYDLEARKDYATALAYVLGEGSYVPASSSAPRANRISWSDAFEASSVSSSADLKLDRVGALFNVAAGHADLAVASLRGFRNPGEVTEALKATGGQFNRAAGIFKLLAEERPLVCHDGGDVTPDITPTAFLALQNTMFANALIATYQVTVDSPAIGDMQCAAIAAGVRDLLASVASYAGAPELQASSVLRRVGLPAAVLSELYDAESHYRAELATPEMEMNLRLARMREATSAISRASQKLQDLDNSDAFTAKLKAYVTDRVEFIEARSKEVNGENSRIYRVYELDASVPAVQGRVIGRPTAYVEDGDVADEALRQFARLAPREVSPCAQHYESLARGKVDSGQAELAAAAADLREAVVHAENAAREAEARIPATSGASGAGASRPATNVASESQALATVKAAVDQGGLTRLQELRGEVRGLAENADTGVGEIQGILSKEAEGDAQLQREAAAYGIPRKDSASLTTGHFAKLKRISGACTQAKNADATIDNQLKVHSSALAALAGLDLSSAVPGSAEKRAEAVRAAASAAAANSRKKIAELRQKIEAAKTLSAEEGPVGDDLDKALAGDDAEAATEGVGKGGDDREEASKLVDKKYGVLIARAQSFKSRATSCASELEQASSAVAGVNTNARALVDEGPTEDSMEVVWTHLPAAEVFQKLHGNLQEGTKFWQGEYEAIRRLKMYVVSLLC